MVEIFKRWYFIIFDGKIIIYLKKLICKCRERSSSKTVFIGNSLSSFFTMKIFFEKVYCNVLL